MTALDIRGIMQGCSKLHGMGVAGRKLVATALEGRSSVDVLLYK